MNVVSSSSPSADRIVHQLQVQQHLKPHQTVAKALDCVGRQAGFGAALCGEALELLRIEPSRKIGRLKGCELTQLARAVWRLWKQPASIPSAAVPAR